MKDPKGAERLDNLHNLATLEVKKLIELMGAEKFGKFAILTLINWTGNELITLNKVTELVQTCPKYFMLGVKSYVERLGDEKANEMFSVTYDDIITGEEVNV